MIDEFLDRFVERFLFSDLDSMIKIDVPTGQQYGNATFPIMMATCSGMELLGGLIGHETFNPEDRDGSDRRRFNRYWDQALKTTVAEYGSIPGGPRRLRSLVRNPLAHSFVTGPGIAFVREPVGSTNQNQHLKVAIATNGRPVLIIDAVQFAMDLRKSYQGVVKPILRGEPDHFGVGVNPTTRASMQRRLDEMIAGYERIAEHKDVGTLEANWVATDTFEATQVNTAINLYSDTPE